MRVNFSWLGPGSRPVLPSAAFRAKYTAKRSQVENGPHSNDKLSWTTLRGVISATRAVAQRCFASFSFIFVKCQRLGKQLLAINAFFGSLVPVYHKLKCASHASQLVIVRDRSECPVLRESASNVRIEKQTEDRKATDTGLTALDRCGNRSMEIPPRSLAANLVLRY